MLRAGPGPDPADGYIRVTLDGFLPALRRGDTYANIHTVAWPDGEIRGQIQPLMPRD